MTCAQTAPSSVAERELDVCQKSKSDHGPAEFENA